VVGLARWHGSTNLCVKGPLQIERANAGKIWVVFVGWVTVIDKVLPYTMRLSVHALKLVRRYLYGV
jgi:hypothetical protein